MAKPSLTAARLRELLSYDPETGVFTRIKRTSRTVQVGDVAGCKHPQGYIVIKLEGRAHKAHRLAWLYMAGEWPADQIDHINRVRDDNRWVNLREASNADNQQNCSAYKRRACDLPPGVWTKGPSDRFHAKVNLNKKVHYLGTFDTPEEAHQAYLAKKRELHSFCTD